MEYKTKYSHAYGVNLKDFLYEIGQITGVNVPEPSAYEMILGFFSVGDCYTHKAVINFFTKDFFDNREKPCIF